MAIEYRTHPPAECRVCCAPMRRARWAAAAGVCSACSTTAEGMATATRAVRLASVRTDTTASTEDRINALARRRAERAARQE